MTVRCVGTPHALGRLMRLAHPVLRIFGFAADCITLHRSRSIAMFRDKAHTIRERANQLLNL